MEMPDLPKLSAQERLDALYEFNLRLFRGIVSMNPLLTSDPNEVEIPPKGVSDASQEILDR